MIELADELLRIVGDSTPALRAIDGEAAAWKRAPRSWSIKEILGHLIDSAANNHQRFVRAQQEQRLVLPGYAQEAWVSAQDYQSRSWPELVDFWGAYNAHLAHVIRRIPESAVDVPCHIGGGDAVTLAFLVQDYLTHLQHHLDQIARLRADL